MGKFTEQVLKLKEEREKNTAPKLKQQFIRAYTTQRNFRETYQACVTRDQRIQFADKLYKWYSLPQRILNKYKKNSEVARLFREQGNECFKQKQFKEALENYNLAILFAPGDDEQLGLAYANRSAVLLELKKPKFSLLDIGLARVSKYPESSVSKLDQRKVRCNQMIRKHERDIATDANFEWLDSELKARRRMREVIVMDIPPWQRNPKISVCPDYIQIEFDEVKGRQMICKRDVPAGAMVMIEDPFVSVLINEIEWDVFHCHHCLKRIDRGIPCKNCVFALYCDESCMVKARDEYHKYECNCFPYLHFQTTLQHILLTIRILSKLGPAELFRIFSTKDPDYEDQMPFGTETNCSYKAGSYLNVYHLPAYLDRADPFKPYFDSYMAVHVATLLEVRTNFFYDIPLGKRNGFKQFLAILILRHLENTLVPAAMLPEPVGLDYIPLASFFDGSIPKPTVEETLSNVDQVPYAVGIYPAFSLIPHSCDPNVFRTTDIENGKIIALTCRPVRAGEAITVAFGNSWAEIDTKARQENLMKTCYVNCNCIACRNDWPVYENMNAKQVRFCCPICSVKFFHENKDSEAFKKCWLGKPDWKCGICKKVYSEEDLDLKMGENFVLMKQAEKFWCLNMPIDAADRLMDPLKFFHTHLVPPNKVMVQAESTYKQAVGLVFYYAQDFISG